MIKILSVPGWASMYTLLDTETKLAWHLIDTDCSLTDPNNPVTAYPKLWWTMEKIPKEAQLIAEVVSVDDVLPLLKLKELIGR